MQFKNKYSEIQVSGSEVFSWVLGKIFKKDKIYNAFTTPRKNPDMRRILRPDRKKVQATWIGHSTFLLQKGGVNILTDPMFSDYASLIQGVGPKRVSAPGLQKEDLPEIHYVLISHNHLDHLDKSSVKFLAKNKETVFLVPTGLSRWFKRRGIANVVEVAWGETFWVRNIEFTSTTAQHWSNRHVNKNKTHWCGWVIEIQRKKIYFAGDSGYSPEFKEIGEKFGYMDLALIPIGAYAPRSIMESQHMNPKEAVQVMLDVNADKAIGMHWGTFRLTDEPLGEPPVLLQEELLSRNLSYDSFLAVAVGETIFCG